MLYYEYTSKSINICVATSAGLFHIENISNFKMTEGNRYNVRTELLNF